MRRDASLHLGYSVTVAPLHRSKGLLSRLSIPEGGAKARVKQAVLVLLMCSVLMTASCRSTLWSRPDEPGMAQFAAMSSPPQIGHEGLTRAVGTITLQTHRFTPARDVAGKSALNLQDCRSLALQDNLSLVVARLEEFTKKAIETTEASKMLPHVLFFRGAVPA